MRRRRTMTLIGVTVVLSIALAAAIEGAPTATRGPLSALRATLARPGAPDVVVEGNRLVDTRTGEEFVPRGVNVPGFEYACAQGWGSSEHAGWLSAIEVGRELRAWNVNTVRIPLNLDCWLGSRDAPVNGGLLTRNRWAYRAAVRTFVDSLRGAGLVTILDLHSRKRRTASDFGMQAALDADGLTFWRSVASEYKDVRGVMFDVLNEPHSRYDEARGAWAFDLTWECWRAGGCAAPMETDRNPSLSGETYPVVGMARAVQVIRSTGARQPIVLGGLDWANDLRGWLSHRPDDDQLVASAHLYDFKRCSTAACFDDELAPVAAAVPLLIGEVGEADGDTAFLTSVIDWADAHEVGYLAWAWLDNPEDQWSLLTADGRPAQPVGQLLKDRLAAYD
ncbi:cellulase family glycosylhydrolase [Nocardioides soli]|uniref:cellulase n=1 Tax=Nocardioides soli TaxID=1036020 RepID=A0A7W4YZL7_9ACTN|nr:hypothetical protein [Nocardioides soli]